MFSFFFFFNDTATTEIYTLSLHDALPIPGLSATMAVALIVPLTYFLSPLAALAAVVTLEACAISAGDIPSALVRIPGTPASAAYADDLYQLGRRGQYHHALGVSIMFSVIGGLFGVAV